MDATKDAIAALTPPALQGEPMVASLTVPAWLYDRMLETVKRLLAGAEPTDTDREIVPALEEAREAQDAPGVTGA
jgi:hypothetical protein